MRRAPSAVASSFTSQKMRKRGRAAQVDSPAKRTGLGRGLTSPGGRDAERLLYVQARNPHTCRRKWERRAAGTEGVVGSATLPARLRRDSTEGGVPLKSKRPFKPGPNLSVGPKHERKTPSLSPWVGFREPWGSASYGDWRLIYCSLRAGAMGEWIALAERAPLEPTRESDLRPSACGRWAGPSVPRSRTRRRRGCAWSPRFPARSATPSAQTRKRLDGLQGAGSQLLSFWGRHPSASTPQRSKREQCTLADMVETGKVHTGDPVCACLSPQRDF